MTKINENFLKLQAGYLFPEIGRRVRAFAKANPNADIIKLGIGDVTEPLAPAVTQAMHNAVDEMSHRETFHGYDDSGRGYDFLINAIIENDFNSRGVISLPLKGAYKYFMGRKTSSGAMPTGGRSIVFFSQKPRLKRSMLSKSCDFSFIVSRPGINLKNLEAN